MTRWDEEGLWWEDEKRLPSSKTRVRPIPAIPPSDWAPPKDFPNLSSAKILGIDTETYDPRLRTHGPGWARNDGHLVGISLSVEDDKAWYFPLRHEIQSEMNMEIEPVLRFFRDVLEKEIPVVGANVQYDAGWLSTEDIHIAGTMYDVQYAEALLNETAKSYSLDAIALKYLGEGKISEDLYRWCSIAYGGSISALQRANIYRAPPTLVGPYAEGDALQPLAILKKQWGDLCHLGMLDLFRLECDLIPILIGMQKRGVTIDLEKTDKARIKLQDMEVAAQDDLNSYAGFDVSVHSPEDLQELCEREKITYPKTSKGNPSFVQKWLENHSNKAMQLVTEVRKQNKARITFIENGIMDKHVNSVIHSSFHPLRGERGGAVSGRFSSSNPNLQFVPSRHIVYAPLIRGLYIPEKFYASWCKFDLSQIEYRFFACDSEDENLIAAYQDRTTDFHEIVGGYLGGKLIRKVTKNFNFGKLYGMGKDTTIRGVKDNLSATEIEELFLKNNLEGNDMGRALGLYFYEVYEEEFPAASKTLKRFSELAQKTGEVRTILNRRSTFNLWEPDKYGNHKALSYDEAVEEWGYAIVRSKTHKALNRRLQGSAADLMKKGMVDAYKKGLFASDKMGFPHLIVHDEWGFSHHPDLNEYFREFKVTIENTLKLKVPVILDAELGPNWGDVKAASL